MAGDGGDGAGAGEGEAEGHPGLSDTSAAGTQGMAGPAGSGSGGVGAPGPDAPALDLTEDNPNFSFMNDPTTDVQSETTSMSPVGLGLGLALAKAFMQEPEYRTPGINPNARSGQGFSIDNAGEFDLASAIGLTDPDANEGGGPADVGILRLARTQPVVQSPGVLNQRQVDPIPAYQYLLNSWNGNQFNAAPITRA